MKKRIITISREFGSGGHSIGKIVAETLGIGFYDQELLEKIAEETGFSKEFIEEAAEYSTAKNSLLFNLVMNRSLHGRMEPSPADTIYFAQTKIIKSLAEKESCVIVGRCSDYILRDNNDCIHVFIQTGKTGRNVFLNATEKATSLSKNESQIKTNGEKSTIHTIQTVRGAYRRITIYALTVTHWVKKDA